MMRDLGCLARIPSKAWGKKIVAVYGRNQRDVCGFLYRAFTLDRDYKPDAKSVMLRVDTDKPFAQDVKIVRAKSCVILEDLG